MKASEPTQLRRVNAVRVAILFLAAACSISLGAATMPEVTRVVVSPALILSVTDGDTVNLAILGSRAFVGGVRLRQVFAMEDSTSGGRKAREHLTFLLPRLTRVRVSQTYSGDGNGTESLCRPVVDVWVESTGLHVNEAHTKWLKANRIWGGTGNIR